MKIKEWITVIAAIMVIVSMAGAAGVWAGDQRWVTAAQINQKLDKIEINALGRQITFLQTKIDENEASKSEKIYIKFLRQQLREKVDGE